MLSRIFLNLLICSLTLCTGQIHLIHIKLYTHMMLRLMEFGQKTYRLDRCPAFIKLREHLLLNGKLVRNRLYEAFLRLLFLTREQLNLRNQVFH